MILKKDSIISALSDTRTKTLSLLENFSQDEMEIPGVIEGWSLKDLLVHLTRWEAELVKLLWQAKAGVQPTTVHFDQDNVDTINERWFQESKSRPFNIVWNDFTGVREQTLRRVKDFSENELNDDQLYTWLDGRPLSEWIAVDSFDHEAEHAQEISTWRDTLGKS
jgi:hypothetical protein